MKWYENTIRWFIPLIAFGVWYMLHDLPPTSKGGFWHYFGWFETMMFVLFVTQEVLWYRINNNKF